MENNLKGWKGCVTLEVFVNLYGAKGWCEESEVVGRIDSVIGGLVAKRGAHGRRLPQMDRQ